MLILICSEKDESFRHSNLVDCVLASQNMFLKAYELGLGACYMGWIDVLVRSRPEVMRQVGVPEGYDVMVPLILGHPREKQGSGKRNKPNVLKWIN